jgi:hypothetical protein
MSLTDEAELRKRSNWRHEPIDTEHGYVEEFDTYNPRLNQSYAHRKKDKHRD